MAKTNNLTDFLTDLADGIRNVEGTTAKIDPQDFRGKIDTYVKPTTKKTAATITPGTSNQTIAAGTYLTGTQTISGDADLTAANIKSGVNIFGVAGTYTSDATAAAGDMLSGKTAYVKGEKVTGNIATKTSSNLTASGATVTVPAGYYASNASKSISSGTASTPATTITSAPSISIDDNGLITASNSKTQSVTPTVSAGYVSSGTAGTITVSGSNTKQLTKRTSSDLTASGATVSVPAGYYPAAASKAIGNVSGSIGGSAIAGSATADITNVDSIRTVASPSGTAGTNYYRIKATATGIAGGYTPKYTVSTGGYIGSTVTGTAQTVSVNGDTTGKTIYIPRASFATSGNKIKTTNTGGGYVPDNTTIGSVTAVSRADTILSNSHSGLDNLGMGSNMTITTTAYNNQGTGYVTGANKTASQTINIVVQGPTTSGQVGAIVRVNDVPMGAVVQTIPWAEEVGF